MAHGDEVALDHAPTSTAVAIALDHLFPADGAALMGRASAARQPGPWADLHFPLDNETGRVGGGLVVAHAGHDGARRVGAAGNATRCALAHSLSVSCATAKRRDPA